jgi:flagellar hook assembly protein FlgD
MILYPYIITLSVYNEAGERVKVIASTTADAPVSSLEFYIEGTTTTTSAISYGSGLDIYLRNVETAQTEGTGVTIFTWKAINEQSQLIDQGVYYIKVETTDPYGHTSTFIKDITVVRVEEYVELNIYNNAGELIRKIKQKKTGLTPSVKLDLQDTIYLSKTQNNILIQYGPGVGENIVWDGKNQEGEIVSNGVYEVQVIIKTQEGTVLEASKKVVVLREDKIYFDTVKAYPNPATTNLENFPYMTFEWTLAGAETGEISIKIYNIAGELVRHITGDLSAGSLQWDMKTDNGKFVARGIYICIIEGRNSEGYRDMKILKVGILGQELEY